jgi:hypothetical protein
VAKLVSLYGYVKFINSLQVEVGKLKTRKFYIYYLERLESVLSKHKDAFTQAYEKFGISKQPTADG